MKLVKTSKRKFKLYKSITLVKSHTGAYYGNRFSSGIKKITIRQEPL